MNGVPANRQIQFGAHVFDAALQQKCVGYTEALDFYRQPALDDEKARIVAIALVGAINTSGMVWFLQGYDTPRAVIVAATKRVLAGV